MLSLPSARWLLVSGLLLVALAGCQRGAEQFSLLDANKDGQLSGEELDVNRDGTISPDEVQFKGTYTRRIEEFLADGGSTDDKQLTPAEFDRALLGKQMPGWMIGIIVALVIGIPVPLGFQLAKNFRMPDHGWKIALIFLIITAAGAITYFGWPPKLGIDLSGGVILIYEIDEEATMQQGVAEDAAKPGDALRDDERININDVVAALRKRVNPGGVKEVIIRPYGDRQVEIIVPEVEAAEVDYIKELIQRTGQLEFLIVANREDHKEIIDKATSPEMLPTRERFLAQAGDWKGRWVPVGVEERQRDKEPDYQGAGLGDVLRAKQAGSERFVQVDVPTDLQREISSNAKNLKQVLDQLGYRDLQVLMAVNPQDRFNIKGSHLRSAMKSYDGSLNPAVNFTMKPDGASLLERLTSENLPDKQREFYRRMAIIMDGEVISAPRLMSTIGRDGQITGNFTEREVDLLVETLRSGRLPAVLRKEPISQSEVSALLGADTIRQGGIAIAASLVITLVFMLYYYRFAGAVACMALLLNLLFTVAAMIAIRAAFTLPGIAGLVLGVGMSVDANILIFERIREETERGTGLRMALRNGFSRAATTIIDSNMTTLITAVVLYAIGTEQIKGFAVTLILGLLISMFTAIFCARVVFDIAERQRWIARLSMTQWIKQTSIDFIGKQRLAIGGSIVLILIGLGAIFARGKNIFDIDFKGGTSVQVLFKQPQPIDEVRAAVEDGPLGDTSVTLVRVEGYEEGRVYKIDSPITGQEEPAVGDPVTYTPPGSNNTLSLRIATVNVAEQKADLASDDRKQKFNGVRWRDFQRDGVRIVQDQLIKIFAGKLEVRSVEVASVESIDEEAPPSGNTTNGEASGEDLKPETTPESTTTDEPAATEGETEEKPATETPATETPATETRPASETPENETSATDTPPATEPSTDSTDEPSSTEGTPEATPSDDGAPSETPPATESGESPAPEEGSRLDRPATFVFTSYQDDKEEGVDPATEPAAERETPAASAPTETSETPATTDPTTTPETGSVTEVGPDEVEIDEPDGETVQVLGLGRTEATLKFGHPVNSPTVTAAIKKAAASQLGILNLPGVRLENPDWDGSPDRRFNEWKVELPLERASAERVLGSMQKDLQGSPVWLSSSKIGPQIAGDLSEKALAALIFATLGIVIYIWFRFHRAVFGVAAVIAMLHDVIITVGLIGLSYYFAKFAGFLGIDEFKINMTIIAAILTVIGYSLNDTVVVFDRIREVRGKNPDLTVAMVNQSVNQTLSRTLLTSFTTILSLLAMYIIGGPSIRGFAFTLLCGIVVGTFSSVYIASPCLLWLMKVSKQAPNRPEKTKKPDLTKAS